MEFSDWLHDVIIPGVAAVVSAVLAYVVAINKASADAALAYTQAASMSVESQIKLQSQVDELRIMHEAHDKTIDQLREQIRILNDECVAKDNQIDDMRREIERLRGEINCEDETAQDR